MKGGRSRVGKFYEKSLKIYDFVACHTILWPSLNLMLNVPVRCLNCSNK